MSNRKTANKMNYFKSFETVQELKDQYKKLVMELHPDMGGDETQFKEMQNEYETLLKEALKGKFGSDSERVEQEMDIDADMREVINQIINIQGIIIEIIGSWLWVSGNTYPVKESLKDAGLKFARKKKAWYWNSGKYRKKSRKKFDLEDLRSMYDSKKVENESNKQLTA